MNINRELINRIKQKTTERESEITIKSTIPLLKWVGGKSYLQNEILALIPENFVNYFDPFVGGGSTLFNVLYYLKLKKINSNGKVYASDINPFLIGFYIHVRDNVESLIDEIKILFNEYNSCKGNKIYRKPISKTEALSSKHSYYYWVRENFNRNIEYVKRSNTNTSVYISAMFYFLNHTCFRGIYKEGPEGFNVPFGQYTNIFKLDEQHFKSISKLIQNVIFTVTSYEDVMKKIEINDFVYLDPPNAYDNTKESYNGLRFNIKQTDVLYNHIKELNLKNIRFMTHNIKVDSILKHVRDNDFKIKEVNSKNDILKDSGLMMDEIIIYNSI